MAALRVVRELGLADGEAWVSGLCSGPIRHARDVCRWLPGGRTLLALELLLSGGARKVLRTELLCSAPDVALVITRSPEQSRAFQRLGTWVRCKDMRRVLAMGSLDLRVDWDVSAALSKRVGLLEGRLPCVRSDDAVFDLCPGPVPSVLAGRLPGGYRVAYRVVRDVVGEED